MLPGPPGEFTPMVRAHLIPYLKRNCDFDTFFTNTIPVVDMPESEVERLTAKLIPDDMSIAYCASPACVKTYISGSSRKALLEKEREIRGILGAHALPPGFSSPMEFLLRELRERKMTLGIAESCTGGMIAAETTSFPGASQVFKGGVVAYSNELKRKLLDIPEELLEKHGAVSGECAGAMVENLCRKLDVDAGIAVTGIAGPGGGTPEKPVGLVYAGIRVNGETKVKKFQFPGDRKRVRERTLHSSVNALLAMLSPPTSKRG
jgi:nicotinamide-nucleotide amidase